MPSEALTSSQLLKSYEHVYINCIVYCIIDTLTVIPYCIFRRKTVDEPSYFVLHINAQCTSSLKTW